MSVYWTWVTVMREGVLVLEVANVPPGIHGKRPAGLCSILTGGDTYANCKTFTAVVTIS